MLAGCANCSGRAGGTSSTIRAVITGVTFGAGRANRALLAGGTLLTIRTVGSIRAGRANRALRAGGTSCSGGTVGTICAIIAGVSLVAFGAGWALLSGRAGDASSRSRRAARPFRAGVSLVAFGTAATPRPPFTLRPFRAAGANGILGVALRAGLLVHYLGGGAGRSRIAARPRFTLRPGQSPFTPRSRIALWTLWPRWSGRSRRTLRAGLRRRRRIVAALELRMVGRQRRRFQVAVAGFRRFQQSAALGRDDR